MDCLTAYRINFQSIYHNNDNMAWCVVNLIENGKLHFESTYLYKNSETLKSISESINKNEAIEAGLLRDFAYNSLIDNIKISICFENYFKAILLASGFIVHKLVPSKLNGYGVEQGRQPIKYNFNKFSWIRKVLKLDDGQEYVFHTNEGINEKTISYGTILTEPEYYKFVGADESMLNLLRNKNMDRNKLHLHVSHTSQYTIDSYMEFYLLDSYVKTMFSKVLQKMYDTLGVPEGNRKQDLIIKPIEEI